MGLTLGALRVWVRQPTTVAGISTVAGTGMGILSGTVTWQAAVPIVLGGIVAMVLPDNSGARNSVERTAADAMVAVQAFRQSGEAAPSRRS